MNDEIDLINCEQCKHLVLVSPKKDDRVFICPICGTINLLNHEQIEGILKLESKPILCKKDIESKDSVILESLPPDLEASIRILIKYGWKLMFREYKKD